MIGSRFRRRLGLVVLIRTISCAKKSNRANLNPNTAGPLATAMQGGQAPCRCMHPRGPLPQRVGGSSEPPEPPQRTGLHLIVARLDKPEVDETAVDD